MSDKTPKPKNMVYVSEEACALDALQALVDDLDRRGYAWNEGLAEACAYLEASGRPQAGRTS